MCVCFCVFVGLIIYDSMKEIKKLKPDFSYVFSDIMFP